MDIGVNSSFKKIVKEENKITIDKINEILDKEVEFVKGCGMPQFVMGIQQAKKVLNSYNPKKCVACSGSGHYTDKLCSSCDGTGYED